MIRTVVLLVFVAIFAVACGMEPGRGADWPDAAEVTLTDGKTSYSCPHGISFLGSSIICFQRENTKMRLKYEDIANLSRLKK